MADSNDCGSIIPTRFLSKKLSLICRDLSRGKRYLFDQWSMGMLFRTLEIGSSGSPQLPCGARPYHKVLYHHVGKPRLWVANSLGVIFMVGLYLLLVRSG